MKLKENSTIKIITGGEAKVLKELGAGGQGTVYKVHYGGKDYALKWYHKPGKQEFYDNLKHNIDKGSPSSAFLWPLFLTEKDSEGCYGYLMELRDPVYREFSDFLLAKVKFQSVEAMIEAGINICYGFRRLHSAGYSYQDLNDGNFFINPANGDVLICDNDNVAPPGTKTGILGKCRYMAPEVVMRKSDPNPQSDRFSLAVILFLLLFNNHPLEGEQVVKYACLTEKNEKVFFGSHPVFIYDPQDTSNRPVPGIHVNVLLLWKQYPDYVRTLFQDQFSQDALHDPSRRITEKEWLNELLLPLRHDLIRCPRCGNEIFARITAQSSTFICEDCGSTLQRPPYPSRPLQGCTLPGQENLSIHHGKQQTQVAHLYGPSGREQENTGLVRLAQPHHGHLDADHQKWCHPSDSSAAGRPVTDGKHYLVREWDGGEDCINRNLIL